MGVAIAAFGVGSLVSLATSWLLVSRLERVGERFGVSEGLLGVVAALAADAPEITAAVAATIHRQRTVGAGVVIGSNAFNLAALLGLGALVAGRVDLHRKVVLLGGAIGMWAAVVCLLAVTGVVDPAVGLALLLLAVGPYLVVLGLRRTMLERLPLPRRWLAWLASAVAEEEVELEVAIRPRRGTTRDAVVAVSSLAVVVAASTAMERGAASLGQRYGVGQIVVGGLVLAATTSLPNLVAGVYLARRGRGAAALSTTLNSNTFNLMAGLLIPGILTGLAAASGQELLAAGGYVGLTALTLAFAYRGRGLGRLAGWVIVACYVAVVAALLQA